MQLRVMISFLRLIPSITFWTDSSHVCLTSQASTSDFYTNPWIYHWTSLLASTCRSLHTPFTCLSLYNSISTSTMPRRTIFPMLLFRRRILYFQSTLRLAMCADGRRRCKRRHIFHFRWPHHILLSIKKSIGNRKK